MTTVPEGLFAHYRVGWVGQSTSTYLGTRAGSLQMAEFGWGSTYPGVASLLVKKRTHEMGPSCWASAASQGHQQPVE